MNTRDQTTTYAIGEIASLAGVSVRTLHYYDQIGLLQPTERRSNDYRAYCHADLLRLQQILFFRELDFPLKEIRQILDNSTVDQITLLKQHYSNLELRINRLRTLQGTIEKTVQNLMKEDITMPLTDEELYEGFDKATIERYNREVQEKYDPKIIAQSDRKIRQMSKSQWQAVQDEGITIARELAALIRHDPIDPEVQALIARQHAWIENFYPAPADVFRGLGDLYATNEEFRAYYDGFAPGLADFMQHAMTHYANTTL